MFVFLLFQGLYATSPLRSLPSPVAANLGHSKFYPAAANGKIPEYACTLWLLPVQNDVASVYVKCKYLK